MLYDSFAQPESDHDEIGVLVDNPRARRVVVYTWNFHPDLDRQRAPAGRPRLPVQDAARPRTRRRARGRARRGSRGQRPATAGPQRAAGSDWPGRDEGLTDRESEILALITQGKSNAEVAALTYLSPNTVKSYIRTIYRKIDVASRTQAVLWGVDHGFTPDHHRIASGAPRRDSAPSRSPPSQRPTGSPEQQLGRRDGRPPARTGRTRRRRQRAPSEKRSGHLRTSQTAATAMSVLR